jgi:hypothetical protein
MSGFLSGSGASSTGGNSVGLFSARPAYGTAGRIYYTTDTPFYYLDTGTSWLQYAFGRPTISPQSIGGSYTGWTAVNISGTESISAVGDSVLVGTNTTDGNLHGWTVGNITTGAGGIYTVTIGVMGHRLSSSYNQVGLSMTDGTKYITWFTFYTTDGKLSLGQHTCNTPTSRNTATAGNGGMWISATGPNILWMRMRFDGTNYNYEHSFDGFSWVTDYSGNTIGNPTSAGAFLTPTKYGIAIENDGVVPTGSNFSIICDLQSTPTNG